MGHTKTESRAPSSYTADYFQRWKDHADKLKKGWWEYPNETSSLLPPHSFSLVKSLQRECEVQFFFG